MAFFVLEDRFSEIECLVFARKYAEVSYLVHADTGVLVKGSLSVREEEPVKLLVNEIEPLIENRSFREQPKTATKNESAEQSVQPEKTPPVAKTAPRRLFLRVPSDKDLLYFKSLNLVELFEGDFPTFFYFADEKRYEREPHGLWLSDYVLRQLYAVLGEENVILK